MNEALFFLTIVINFSGILLAYKFFGKAGLFSWIALATVLTNIEVLKCVDMFSLSLTLGNVLYGTTFLATDILNEMYGLKEARKAVYIGLFSMILFTIISQVNLLFIPNEADFASDAMKTLFSLTPRLCVASLIAFFVSNLLDTYLFDVLKRKYKALYIRNNVSTMISQLIDNVIFTFLAFGGVFPLNVLGEIIFTSYIIKLIVSACDTPFIYLAKKIKKMEVQNG